MEWVFTGIGVTKDGEEALHAARRFKEGFPFQFEPRMSFLKMGVRPDAKDDIDGYSFCPQTVVEAESAGKATVVQWQFPTVHEEEGGIGDILDRLGVRGGGKALGIE